MTRALPSGRSNRCGRRAVRRGHCSNGRIALHRRHGLRWLLGFVAESLWDSTRVITAWVQEWACGAGRFAAPTKSDHCTRRRWQSRRSSAAGSGPHQGVVSFELWEGREVTIRSPKLAHAMLQTQRGDAGVMDPRAGDLSPRRELAELLQVPVAFGQKVQVVASQPGVNRREGGLKQGGSLENPDTRHHGDKLMHTRPGDCPRSRAATDSSVWPHWAATRMKSFGAVSGLGPLRVTCTVWTLLAVAVTVWVAAASLVQVPRSGEVSTL